MGAIDILFYAQVVLKNLDKFVQVVVNINAKSKEKILYIHNMTEIGNNEESGPFVSGKPGLNFEVLSSGKFIDPQGKEFVVEKEVGFWRIIGDGREMMAQVDDGVLEHVRLFTKYPGTEEKHPHMYASEFLEAFLQDCEKNGLEIDEYREKWMRGSGREPYDTYQRVFAETGDKVKAAQANLPLPLISRGLTYIRNPEIDITETKYPGDSDADIVRVVFHKQPDNPPVASYE